MRLEKQLTGLVVEFRYARAYAWLEDESASRKITADLLRGWNLQAMPQIGIGSPITYQQQGVAPGGPHLSVEVGQERLLAIANRPDRDQVISTLMALCQNVLSKLDNPVLTRGGLVHQWLYPEEQPSAERFLTHFWSTPEPLGGTWEPLTLVASGTRDNRWQLFLRMEARANVSFRMSPNSFNMGPQVNGYGFDVDVAELWDNKVSSDQFVQTWLNDAVSVGTAVTDELEEVWHDELS